MTDLRSSFHLQRHPAASFNPKPPPRKRPGPRLTAPKPTATVPPCTECGRSSFVSWKALFGHMRCHPERLWRGINPPDPAHRRRRPAGGRFVRFTAEEHEVAASLVMLANGRGVTKSEGCLGLDLNLPPPPPLLLPPLEGNDGLDLGLGM